MDNVTRLLMQGAAGAAGDKTYIDDVFNTFLYKGDGSTSHAINTGFDLSASRDGGMVWFKSRSASHWHSIFDTVRGANKSIYPNSTWQQESLSNTLNSFNNNGFTVGYNSSYSSVFTNANNDDYSSWSFRKQKGFFDVVTYTGSGGQSSSPQTINHSLESIPGMIIIKNLDQSSQWFVYHVGIGEDKFLQLNKSDAAVGYNGGFKNITSSSVGVFDSQSTNGNEYVAYFFAGGESTAETARSLTFDGSYDSLQLASSSDFNFGTGDFTFEGWLKPNNNTDFQVFLNWGSDNPSIGISNDSNSYIYYNSTVNTKIAGIAAVGQWTHYAISRSSGTTRLFLNGELKNSFSDSHDYGAQALSIGAYINGNNSWNGSISNVRIVKGTAVYTSSFRPPTEPLTNITNTVLLCCNNSSTTGSTVTPGTITAENNVTASTDSPFDDPEGFKFGEGGDQNIIKCGTYDGNPNSANINVEIGWEPQFFMVKSSTASSTEWLMWDSMRGVVTDYNDARLSPSENAAEYGGQNAIDFTPTGIRVRDGDARVNGGNGQKLIYIAIRRPDGYVGKPALAGTDVFAMDAGAGSSTIPNFDSGFPVDFAFEKTIAGGNSWSTGARLIQGRYLYTNTDMAAGTWDKMVFDSNTGWNDHSSYGSGDQSWMWKRGAGFDVVTYTGNEYNLRQIPHSLGKTPEMMWLKYRGPSGYNEDWQVYHKGLNGGVNPQDYAIRLDSASAQYNSANDWGDTAPTSTHFTIGGSDGRNNRDGSTYINILFASVDGISKLGNWVGDGGTQTITLGFQPRFLLLKTWNTGGGWYMLDTRRGWGAGNDASLQLQEGNAQVSSRDDGAPTATGFTVTGDVANEVGRSYIYYAHA